MVVRDGLNFELLATTNVANPWNLTWVDQSTASIFTFYPNTGFVPCFTHVIVLN